MKKTTGLRSGMLMVFILLLGYGSCFAVDKANIDRQNIMADGQKINWNTITVLDLETAAIIALSENPGLNAAAARVRQARQQVAQAVSTYFPRVDATGSGSRVDLSDSAYETNLANAQLLSPLATIKDPEEYYKAGLSASLVLFNGFERKFTHAAARYGEKMSRSALNDARRLLLFSVSSAFFSAQLALENIAIARADESFNQKLLKEAEARYRVGTGSLSDVLNFKVRKNEAKTNRINQEYEYEIAMYGLAALLGITEARFPDHVRLKQLSSETIKEMVEPDVEPLMESAKTIRPDIQKGRWAVKQADAGIKTARAGYFPQVSLSGALDGERTGDWDFGQDDFGNSIQVGLTWNLFAGGLYKARVKEAKEKKSEASDALENLILSASSEIRSAHANVVTAQTQVGLQRENVDLVKETRDLVEKEYAAGQGSLVRLNEAQKDFNNAKSRFAQSLVGLRLAWISLETRTGRILKGIVP